MQKRFRITSAPVFGPELSELTEDFAKIGDVFLVPDSALEPDEDGDLAGQIERTGKLVYVKASCLAEDADAISEDDVLAFRASLGLSELMLPAELVQSVAQQMGLSAISAEALVAIVKMRAGLDG